MLRQYHDGELKITHRIIDIIKLSFHLESPLIKI